MAKQFRIKHGLVVDEGGANITGSVGVSGSIELKSSGSTILDIQGSEGQLFSVVDSLSGSLMSVNDISGLPILEVFSDDTVVMGEYGTNALVVTGSKVGINTATPSKALEVSGSDALIHDVTVGRGEGDVGTNTAVGKEALFLNVTGEDNTAVGETALRSNTSGNSNTAVGRRALLANTTGRRNTAVGMGALCNNTSGYRNVAMGVCALRSNTTGGCNVAVGDNALLGNTAGLRNTALGTQALSNNTTGGNNTASGFGALQSNTTGGSNAAFGYKSLNANTTGARNTAVGYKASNSNTTGKYNTAVGASALFTNTTGTNHVAIGDRAMITQNGGIQNTAVGVRALNKSTSSSNNTALGFKSLYKTTTGGKNVAVGVCALLCNVTGEANTAVGFDTLKYNTSGKNVAIGRNAMFCNTTGNTNTAVGYSTLRNNTTGVTNTAIGGCALFSNTEGDRNVAVGNDSLCANTTGDNNTALGFRTLCVNTTGNDNVGIGCGSLQNNTTGCRNTALGFKSLNSNTTARDLTAIGHYALLSNTTGANNVAVGKSALQSNQVGLRNTAVGNFALRNNTTNYNTAVGAYALDVNTTGGCNTALGDLALRCNTTGAGNTALGRQALCANTTGANNTAVGVRALRQNTSGRQNVAVGVNSMCSSTTSIFNTAVGYEAGCSITSARRNTAIGWKSLKSVTTAGCNTALGAEALLANTAGANTAVGALAMCANTTGLNNTALGTCALKDNTTGQQNTALGTDTLKANTLGCRNTAVGQQALTANTTGIRNVALGTQALCENNGSSNIGVGYRAFRNLGVGSLNTGIGNLAGACLVTGSYNTIIGAADADGFDGQNNNIFISDGQGNTRIFATGSNGNVGIGTTSPEEKLSIGTGNIQLENNRQISWSDIGDGNNGRVYIRGNEDNDWIQFTVDNSNSKTMRWDTIGLGLGTITPTEKLTVEGSISASGDLTLNGNIYKAIESSYLGLYGGSDSTDNDGFIKIHGNANYWGRVQTNIGYSSASSKAYWTLSNSTELMTLTGAGNLGIGTSTPSSSLHVEGNVQIGSNKLKLGADNADSYIQHNGSNLITHFQSNWGGDFKFRAADTGGTQHDILFIEGSNQRVGIGNTSPVDMLHVSGGDVMVYNNSIGQYQWRYDANQPVWSVGGGNYFTIRKSSTRLVTLNSSGNFGIGNNSPVEKLTVEGNISASGDLYVRGRDFYLGLEGNEVRLFGDNFTNTAPYNHFGNGPQLVIKDGNTVVDENLIVISQSRFIGDVNMSGDLTVDGIVTAQEFHTEFVSASVIYESGSTKFGDTQDDTHSFTGSLELTGSLTVSETGSISYITGDRIFINNTDDGHQIGKLIIDYQAGINPALRSAGNDYIRFNNSILLGGNGDNIKASTNHSEDLYLQHQRSGDFGFRFTTADSGSVMRIDGSGNVGIGTTSPSGSLHIDGTTPSIYISDSSNSGPLNKVRIQQISGSLNFSSYNAAWQQHKTLIKVDGNVGEITFPEAGYVHHTKTGAKSVYAGRWRVGDNTNNFVIQDTQQSINAFEIQKGVTATTGTIMYLKNDGNVGIGTTSPTYKLDVSGSGRFYDSLDINQPYSHLYRGDAAFTVTAVSASTPQVRLISNRQPLAQDSLVGGVEFFGQDTNSGTNSLAADIKAISDASWGSSASTPGALTFSTNPPDAGISALEERMRIDSDGNVGIGTSSPTEKLHVSGNILLRTPGALSPELQFNNANVGAYRNNNRLVVAGYSGISFKSSNAAMSAQTERMRITSDGDVGIGTIYPSVKLHISDATAPNFRLSRTGTGQIWEQGIDSSGRFQLKEAASEGGTQYTRFQVDDTGEVQFGAYGQGNITGTAAYTLAVDSSGNIIEVDSSGVNTGENTDVDTGTEVVDTFTSGSGASAFTNYVVNDGTNYRAGQLMSVWNASGDIEYTDVSTNSIGDTSEVLIFASINGADVEVKATVPTDNWTVKVSSTIL